MSYVIAHRGACWVAPENTLAAFSAALKMGCDGIETDIQLTADDQLVICHNYSVEGITGQPGLVREMTLAQLRQLDFGAHKGPAFAGERIATLDECLEVCRPLQLVNLELKPLPGCAQLLVQKAVAAVKAHGMQRQVIFSSFDHALMGRIKAMDNALQVGLLTPAEGLSASPMLQAAAAAMPAKPLSEIRLEDIRPEALAGMEGADILASTPAGVVYEMAATCGGIFPGKPLGEIAAALAKREQDFCAYIAGLDFKPDFFHPDYRTVLRRPALVQQLQAMGVYINVYTPNDPADLAALAGLGCHGLITNRPDLLLPQG